MQHRVLACRAPPLSLTRSRTVSSPGNIDRQTFVFTAHMHEGVHVQKKHATEQPVCAMESSMQHNMLMVSRLHEPCNWCATVF